MNIAKHLESIGAVCVGIALGAALVTPAAAAETESAIARGGRLYDKWWTENKAPSPPATMPPIR